ncbi:tetratricopeptide repeat protein [Paraburkholderia bannensis]|uniref:tetratricopeptide repeat protein n=1 Tax=Paraburkholderia bannensis TaxID=765414 RepID=UPI0005AB2B81|nr:tetratricopeptide repeat protein [Paraburkholderia bannensis]
MKRSKAVRVALALSIALAGVASGTASRLASAAGTGGQPSVSAESDPQTANAVADYNAGNLTVARTEFQSAAAHGNRLAEFNYAMMLLNGEGGAADVSEGRKWLHKAADANMSHAQYVYGKMYDDGDFVDRNPVEAHQWFLKAAKQGHVQAELALANQFLDGRGTGRDNKQAFYWYKKAAEGGDMTAQYVTGSFYERGGDGVPKNLNVARAYYAAAASQGDPVARLKFQQLSAQLMKAAPAQPQ